MNRTPTTTTKNRTYEYMKKKKNSLSRFSIILLRRAQYQCKRKRRRRRQRRCQQQPHIILFVRVATAAYDTKTESTESMNRQWGGKTKKKNLAMTIDDHDYDVTIAACCRVSNDCVFVVRLAIAVRHTHACRIRRKRFSTPSNIYTGFHYEKCLARVLLLHLYLTLAILASQHQQPQQKQLEMDKHLFVYCVFAFTIHAWMYDKLCYYASKRIWFNRNDSTNHTNTACCISDIVEWDAL